MQKNEIQKTRNMPEYKAAIYKERKEKKICIRCGEKTEGITVHCESCKEKIKKNLNK